ncbi:MAG: rhodanese-like domain-containing protein [Desulfobulbus sp.]|nr:MAG: rhodanese-like domain-containing protein [Desulfobulbus sp.]
MTRKKFFFAWLVSLVLAGMPGLALAYNLIEPDALKARIESKQPTILVDIQPKNAYNEHHFFGSVRTFAYPAKTDMDTNSLIQAVRLFESNGNEVVIIGPRGTRAEQRTVDFLASRGIPEDKLFILKGGINGWPYKNMLLNIRGGCQ